jgi:hypothetical protein
MRKVQWSFDCGPTYEGLTDESRWNGFLNVYVTPETRSTIAADLRASGYPEDADSAEEIESLPVVDGLVPLTNGWAITEEEKR